MSEALSRGERRLLTVNRVLRWVELAVVPAPSLARPMLGVAADVADERELWAVAWLLRGAYRVQPELDLDRPTTLAGWWVVEGQGALAAAWWRSPLGALVDELEGRLAGAAHRASVRAADGHTVTDPACRRHRAPATRWDRWRDHHGRGRGCRVCGHDLLQRMDAAGRLGTKLDPPRA